MRRPVAQVLGVAAAALLLAGCGAAGAASPTWVPQPSFSGDGGSPETFGAPGGTPSAPSGTPGPSAPSNSRSNAPAIDPQVMAKHLSTPTGIAILPDNTALVGERTTGRILHVQPVAGQPVTTVRTLTGLDTTGDGGLLDLAISPTYAQDGLIYAYLTTPTDNRVVHFTLTGPATSVLQGIPRAKYGNTGRIMFDANGNLYIGTGNAGQPALAASATSLAGKVLRVNDIGQPAAGNPQPSSPVFASGFRNSQGLCQDAADSAVLQNESGPDQVNIVTRGGDYTAQPGVTLPARDTAIGGCAFIKSRLYITSRDGKELLQSTVTASAGSVTLSPFTKVDIVGSYGRLLTVVSAPDNSLWLTTSNRDGHGTPVPDDERVLRIIPPQGGGESNSPV